jgi:hypothetical protein
VTVLRINVACGFAFGMNRGEFHHKVMAALSEEDWLVSWSLHRGQKPNPDNQSPF